MRSKGSAHGGFEKQDEEIANARSCRINIICKRRGGEAMEDKKELFVRREKTMSWPSRGEMVLRLHGQKKGSEAWMG